VKTLHKTLRRWTGTFRGLNPADLLLLYAGSMPRAGCALWHSHPRNRTPHVHVEAAKPKEENAQEPHRHIDGHEHHRHAGPRRTDNETSHEGGHEHDESHRAGHWHFVIPAELIRLANQLLELAVSEISFALRDFSDSAIACRPACSARAPPH